MGYKNIISGIYMIKNIINGKVYIGKSTNLQKRLYEHKRELRKNEHDNIYLQRSWNKYCENNFEFIILENCDRNELNLKEKEYIQNYKSNDDKFGFNMTNGGDGCEGFKLSEESRRKISECQIGRKLTPEWKRNISESHKGKMTKNINIFLERNEEIKKYIIQSDLEGNFIKEWHGINECGRKLKIQATNIVKCLKGKYKKCGGFKWMYLTEYIKLHPEYKSEADI